MAKQKKKPSKEEFMQHAKGQTEPQQELKDAVVPAADERSDDPIEQAQQLVDEMSAVEPEEKELHTITEEDVQRAMELLNKYMAGKASVDARVVANQNWWKLRHWGNFKSDHGKEGDKRIKPASAWLHSCIDNKVADYMDNFPEPNILPQEEGDKETAKQLSAVVPVVLDENGFEQEFDQAVHSKVLNGTGIYAVVWDQDKLNGLGDVSVKKCDILNFAWEPGIENIQDSANLFHITSANNDALVSQYPQLKDRLSSMHSVVQTEYQFDDTVDKSNRSQVVDWYYKVNVDGKNVVHYVKFCNGVVLYATENDPERKDTGLYIDGKYPFVFDPLFRVAGSPAGYGYVDLCKEPQEYIDKLSQAMLENAIWSSVPRYLVRDDGEINEDDFADTSKHFIKVGNNVGQDTYAPIVINGIDGNAYNMLMHKIDEMKETSGNRDVSSGGTSSGVTAASAISAMQEAGSKTSRWQIKGTYRAYKEIILMVIERIRQFYDMPRVFRITGTDGSVSFETFSNQDMQERRIETLFPDDEYYQMPNFDVDVSASKASPYSKLAQNELAVQMYNLGVLNPQNADQALALLDMMDINHKDRIVQRVQENGTMWNTIQQMTQALNTSNEIIKQLTGQDLMSGQDMTPGAMSGAAVTDTQSVDTTPTDSDSLGNTDKYQDNSLATQARKRVATSTSPE